MLTSCDMDLTPAGSLNIDKDIQSIEDITALRTQLYSSLRSATGGAYIYLTDLQMDQFNGTADNGNRNGTIANAVFNSSTGEFATMFANCYSRISSVNFFIREANAKRNSGTLSEKAVAMIDRYIGEAKFIRAYSYWYLFNHYCQPYSADIAQTEHLGLPLVYEFAPSGNPGSYPARSTMAETLDRINTDLTDAYNALKAYEATDNSNCAPNAVYLSSFAVEAFQARIALQTGDYNTAITKASSVINSGKYPLAGVDTYEAIWTDDEGSELIFVPSASANEPFVGSIFGVYNSTTSATSADYIPSQPTLLAYEDGDIRFDAFFTGNRLSINGTNYVTFIFNKWPGNSALGTGLLNKPKPFRTSEQYLILAEAYAALGNTTEANKALNDLREKRFAAADFEEVHYQDNALVQAIRNERKIELIGEGFRMGDLRRWKQGFFRNGDYSIIDQAASNTSPLSGAVNPLGVTVSYNSGDFRYTWPIPSAEMDINPQLEGQQNPGY